MRSFRNVRLADGEGGGSALVRLFRGLGPLARRFARDEEGADLVEYGLLAVSIAILSVLVFPDLVSKMGTAFSSWGSGVQSIWTPNPPQ